MAEQVEKQAPFLWTVLGGLLNSDPSHEECRTQVLMRGTLPSLSAERHREGRDANSDEGWDEEDEYWERLEGCGGDPECHRHPG